MSKTISNLSFTNSTKFKSNFIASDFNPNVTSVTIVEKYQEVIDLVWPHCPKDETFTLVHSDIKTWNPTQNFDCAWFDTWLLPEDHQTHMGYLIDKYQPYCGWIDYWTSL